MLGGGGAQREIPRCEKAKYVLRQPNRCQAAATGVAAPGPAWTKAALCAVSSSKSEDKGTAPEYKINVRICAGQKVELQVLQTRPQEMLAPQRLVLFPSSDTMQTAHVWYGTIWRWMLHSWTWRRAVCWNLTGISGGNLPTLQMEAAPCAIMSVNFYQATRCSHP
jgi:hypothetical protein